VYIIVPFVLLNGGGYWQEKYHKKEGMGEYSSYPVMAAARRRGNKREIEKKGGACVIYGFVFSFLSFSLLSTFPFHHLLHRRLYLLSLSPVLVFWIFVLSSSVVPSFAPQTKIYG
jgi:hypothetical protein